MHIKQDQSFTKGYNKIVSSKEIDGALMDFGIIKLDTSERYVSEEKLERVFMLITGEVEFQWEGQTAGGKRSSFLDENPTSLHVSAGVDVVVIAKSDNTEIAYVQTVNEFILPSEFISKDDCRVEIRGEGVMQGASKRKVRTLFDYSTKPESKLVLGEVVGIPGRWSSFPPHNHPQPEIYFYKFFPEDGYGHSEIGEDVVKVKNNDTVILLDGKIHPQVSAPGYAMYIIWIIRHFDDNPYTAPIFLPEYNWVAEPDADIWSLDE